MRDNFSAVAEETAAEINENAAREKKAARRSAGRRAGHGLFRFILTLVIIAMLAVNAWVIIDTFQFSLLVVSIDMSQSKLDLFEQENASLFAPVRSFGLSETLGLSEPEVIWTSSDDSVAAVSADGEVTAVAPGKATITAAEAKSGLSATCAINVYSLTDIVLNADKCSLGAGEEFSLEAAVSSNEFAEPFEYIVSDSDIVSVAPDGKVTALAAGTTAVTVNARGYTSAKCSFTVYNAPSYLNIYDTDQICLEETRALPFCLGEGEYCSDYTFTSSDPNVISIDEKGVMKAVGQGSAVISVSAFNGLSCEHFYTVTGQPQYVKLGFAKMAVYSGMGQRLEPQDSTGFCQEYYYTSSDPSIVTVEPDGTVIGHNKGTADVTCSTYNGRTNTISVTVTIVNYVVPYTAERVAQNIEALASTYPEIISTEVIGKSVKGRDITLVKLGTGEKKALVVAGLHSRENIGTTFTMRCIEEYAEAYYNRTGYYDVYNLRSMLNEYTLYFVPLMNPDGLNIATAYESPLYTTEPIDNAKFKNNANGVNLNRNFPFLWGYSGPDGSVNTTTPDTDSWAGASEASEPETQAIIELCRANSFEWLLDMHCRGNIVYYQDQYNEVKDADNKLASRLSRKCGYTLTDQSTGYEISGGLENWFRSEFGKPGICVELVLSNYAYHVSGTFEAKTDWLHTRITFLLGMMD